MLGPLQDRIDRRTPTPLPQLFIIPSILIKIPNTLNEINKVASRVYKAVDDYNLSLSFKKLVLNAVKGGEVAAAELV